MGEWYKHHDYREYRLDLHARDAKRLGFVLNHPNGIASHNGKEQGLYQPLTLQFHMYSLSSADYRECEVCGENHEELVIAFLDDERKSRDARIVKLSEERAKKWEEEGLDQDLAHEFANSGLSKEDIVRLIKLEKDKKGGKSQRRSVGVVESEVEPEEALVSGGHEANDLAEYVGRDTVLPGNRRVRTFE